VILNSDGVNEPIKYLELRKAANTACHAIPIVKANSGRSCVVKTVYSIRKV